MLHPHKLSVVMNTKRFNKYYICSRLNLKDKEMHIHVPEYVLIITYTYFVTAIQILEVLVF